jgi:hypothetical protein
MKAVWIVDLRLGRTHKAYFPTAQIYSPTDLVSLMPYLGNEKKCNAFSEFAFWARAQIYDHFYSADIVLLLIATGNVLQNVIITVVIMIYYYNMPTIIIYLGSPSVVEWLACLPLDPGLAGSNPAEDDRF